MLSRICATRWQARWINWAESQPYFLRARSQVYDREQPVFQKQLRGGYRFPWTLLQDLSGLQQRFFRLLVFLRVYIQGGEVVAALGGRLR